MTKKGSRVGCLAYTLSGIAINLYHLCFSDIGGITIYRHKQSLSRRCLSDDCSIQGSTYYQEGSYNLAVPLQKLVG